MAMAEHRVLDLVGLQLDFWLATIKGCLEATASLLAMVTMHQAVSVRLSPTLPVAAAVRAECRLDQVPRMRAAMGTRVVLPC